MDNGGINENKHNRKLGAVGVLGLVPRRVYPGRLVEHTQTNHSGGRRMQINTVPYLEECKLTPPQYRINQLIWQFDVDTRRFDALWGVDNLPKLSGMEDKWRSQIDKLNAAIQAQDVAEVECLVAGCYRGYAAMDRKAREAGHRPLHPTGMATTMPDGTELYIAASGPDQERLKEKHPDAVVYSLKEIANILHTDRYALVNAVKAITGGTIRDIRPVTPDDVPF